MLKLSKHKTIIYYRRLNMIRSSTAQLKIKYLYFTALIGLGFLWMGTAYLVQAFRLFGFLDGGTVNLLTMGVYYVCQAAGIGAVGLLFAKRASFAGGRALPLCTTVIALVCMAVSMFIPSVAVIIASGALLNLAIGVISGCYLTRLATNIPQKRRGIVFGGAYAFGSLGTWLLSMPMGGRFLWHGDSFFAVAATAALSLLLLLWLSPPPAAEERGYLRKCFEAKDIWLAAAVVFLLLTEQGLGFTFPIKAAAGGVYIEFTRIFYGAGLIIAGFVSDKDRRWGAICCLAALAFPFAALALGSSAAGETIMWVLAYVFLGFLAVYRILVFSDISGNSGMPAFAVFGLLAGRLGEAAGTLGAGIFTGSSLVIFSGAVFVLLIPLFFLLYQKLYNTDISPEEAEERRQIEYTSRFGLSAREQEIFNLIIQGMSNMEIAGALYITESTVKFHAGNILKKTNSGGRLELITDYKLWNNR
jgi:DNA-binding CsgD family transcriptional regulator/MFS family permease